MLQENEPALCLVDAFLPLSHVAHLDSRSLHLRHVISWYTFLREIKSVKKTNLTLSLEADLVREAKVLAARRGTSVSRLMSENLEQLIRSDKDYETARRRATARLARGFELEWTKPASRHELHER